MKTLTLYINIYIYVLIFVKLAHLEYKPSVLLDMALRYVHIHCIFKDNQDMTGNEDGIMIS